MIRIILTLFTVAASVALLVSCEQPEDIKIQSAKQRIEEALNAKKPICSADLLSAMRTASGPEAASNFAKSDDCQNSIEPASIALKNIVVSKIDSSVVCGDITANSPLGNKIENKVVLLGDSVIYGDTSELLGDGPRILLNRIAAQQYSKYCN